jgi:hypothetical protein
MNFVFLKYVVTKLKQSFVYKKQGRYYEELYYRNHTAVAIIA